MNTGLNSPFGVCNSSALGSEFEEYRVKWSGFQSAILVKIRMSWGLMITLFSVAPVFCLFLCGNPEISNEKNAKAVTISAAGADVWQGLLGTVDLSSLATTPDKPRHVGILGCNVKSP
ncbi:MAG: hypothetical protein JJT82_06665 [Legionellaceae bacterium]|nr:hypothetical protein [Legionellaceae bacterium]